MSEKDKSDEPRTAVVTGASSGFGAAIAVALGELGWRVAVGARRFERLKETAALVEEAGGRAFAHRLDVSDSNSIDDFFAAVESELGVADVIVNNAGLSHPGLLEKLEPEKIREEIAVNLLGPALVSRRALAPLRAGGLRGDFIFISSDAKRSPRPHQSIYTATKAGLEGLAAALALEFEGTGLRSTIVRPGPAASEYAASWGEGKILDLLSHWRHFGLQRHLEFMPAEAVARGVVLVATTPAGVRIDTLEIQPEAPLSP